MRSKVIAVISMIRVRAWPKTIAMPMLFRCETAMNILPACRRTVSRRGPEIARSPTREAGRLNFEVASV
jgi:hypothetical protein